MIKRFNPESLQKLVILWIVFALMLIFSLTTDTFFTKTNFQNIARQISMVIITGSVATLLIISGNFDLSVGGIVALTNVLFAKFAQFEFSLWIAGLFAVLVGGIIGILNGAIVENLKISPIITTLGMMFIARGLAFIFAGARSVAENLPTTFSLMGRGFVGPFPIPLFLTIFFVIVFVILQKKSILGKYSYAIGGNRHTAVLSGIKAGQIVKILFLLTGLSAGFSGVLMASRIGVGQPIVGVGFEFDVIVAVLLGGTSVKGGEGSVFGMAVGATILGVLANGLNLLGVHTFYQDVVKGIVLVCAVLLDRRLKAKIG